MAKEPSPIQRPKMGGKRKSFSKPPSKKANEEYGMAPKKKAASNNASLEPKMGNREFGFIQTTPAKATAATVPSQSGRGLAPPRMPKGPPKLAKIAKMPKRGFRG